MKYKLVLIMLLSFSTIGITSLPKMSYACDCVKPQSVEESREMSDVVFAGNVLKIMEQKHTDGSRSKKVLFEVSQAWKGLTQSQIIITTGLSGGECGYQFFEGEEYLVYGIESNMYGGKETLTTGICSRTSDISTAKEDMDVLGSGKKPTQEVNLEKEIESSHNFIWWISLALVAGITIFSWRKVRKSNSSKS